MNSGKSSVVVNPQGDVEEVVIEAAEGCPVRAIATVADAETGEQLFP
jgi:ferredoxin